MSQPLSTRACGLAAGGRSPGSRAYCLTPSHSDQSGGCAVARRGAPPVTVAGPRRIRTDFPRPPAVERRQSYPTAAGRSAAAVSRSARPIASVAPSRSIVSDRARRDRTRRRRAPRAAPDRALRRIRSAVAPRRGLRAPQRQRRLHGAVLQIPVREIALVVGAAQDLLVPLVRRPDILEFAPVAKTE